MSSDIDRQHHPYAQDQYQRHPYDQHHPRDHHQDHPKHQLHVQVPTDETDAAQKPYHYSFTYEKATMYEYKYDRAATPDPVDPCYRCNRRVYGDNVVNVGVLFHKQCFRCRVCGVPLSAQTFYRNDANDTLDKEAYCRQHVGRAEGEVVAGEPAPNMDHLSPNSRQYVIQIDGRVKQPDYLTPNHSPGSTHTPRSGTPTHRSGTPTHRSNTPNSLGRLRGQHQPAWGSGSLPRPGARGKPVLQSYEDFERAGVFEAQNVLEQRHKEEEDRLQRFLAEEREREMKKVDLALAADKEQAATELLASVAHMSLQKNNKQLIQERDRLEEHFQRDKDERVKVVMDKIALEEKTRQSKLTEKHGHEMMMLIAEKDREVDYNSLYDHSMRAPVGPPQTKKSQLYESPLIFENIDKRAIELSIRDYMSHTDLVRDLTRDCTTELQKARVLFRWVIAKDLNRHNVTEIVRPNSSASLLKGVKSGKETYHQLFKKLCSYAGLHCEIILGYSKGAGYKPGMRVEGGAFRNSWTAVCIDGSWRFVNCTWAARHVTGHKDDLPQMYHKYDEFYFLTDPEDYIYQHYPDDTAWQLLEIPLPFSEFTNLPVVKSPFFNYGLKFYSNYGATITTDNGMAEIRLITPSILGFGSLLEPFDKTADKKDLEGRTLLRLVKNEAIFTISLPKPGVYYFSVYIGDYWQSECLESACSFVIDCKHMPGVSAPPYPPVPYYGPTPLMNDLNIVPTSYTDPLVVMNGENLEINFRVEKDVKTTHTFQYFDVSDSSITDVDRYVFLRSRNDHSALYMARCSKEGYYIFSLYATSSTSESLDCVYRYLIVCQQANLSVNVFPKTFHRWNKCVLHEPLSGDLLSDKRYVFRMDIPEAIEVFVVIGEIWYHLRHKVGTTWEGSIHTGKKAGLLKVYARYTVNKDSSIFGHLLDYEVVEDGETEI